MGGLTVARLVCGVYAENCYLLAREGREDCALVDPGDGYEAIARALRESGRKLTDILLTHGHFDHFLAAPRLAGETGARVHIHPLDAYMLGDPADSQYNPQDASGPFRPFAADCLYAEEVEAAGTRFQVLHTPGHTPGGVCLLSEADGILFSGDTIFAAGYGRTDLAGGSVHELVGSLRRLLALPRSLTVCSGHGETATMEEIARYFGR